MKPLIALALLLCAEICFAQDLTIYYNKNWEIVPAAKKVYVRTATFDVATHAFVGAVTDTYKKGQVQMTGQYQSKKKEGVFTFYYENGNVEATGSFSKDARVGLWKYFYRDGKPKLEIEFTDNGNSDIKFLNDSIGNTILKDGTGKWVETLEVYNDKPYTIKGDFVNNAMVGVWTIYSSKGKKLLEEKYENGVFIADKTSPQPRKIYPLSIPFKLVVTEEFMTDNYSDLSKEQSSILVKKLSPVSTEDLEKKRIAEEEAMKQARIDSANARTAGPAFPLDGLPIVIAKVNSHFEYPDAARAAAVEGDLSVQFTVQPDGHLANFTVAPGIGSGCEEAVLSAWQEYAKENVWMPARYNSVSVKQRFAVPFPCVSTGDKIYTEVDEPASAKGGVKEMMRFINTTMKYPPAARNKGMEGTVLIEYIVEADGRLTNVVVKESAGHELDAEAFRVVSLYAAKYIWNPGKKNGKAVRVRFALPVMFQLGYK